MKRRIKSSFNRACRTYQQSAQVQRRVAAACSRLVPDRAFSTVLEIGAGGGLLTELLLQRIEYRLYLALDLAQGMLSCLDRGGLPRLCKVVADGERPPLRPGGVDLLVSASTLQWYQMPERSIPANLDLLRPGGAFALSLFVTGTLGELAAVVRATGVGSVHNLRSAESYADVVRRVEGVKLETWEDTQVEHVPSVLDLLARLRRAGVTATSGKRPVTPQDLTRFCRTYETEFATPAGIPVTYRVLHLWGTKG